MIRNQQRAVVEAFIPLLGYFWFQWSLSYIVFFLMLDLIAREISLHISANKIYKTQGGKPTNWIRKGGLSSCLVVATIAGWLLLMKFQVKGFVLADQLWNFLAEKEWGISQGWLLVPLIVLSVISSFKLEFLRFELHKKVNQTGWWKPQVFAAKSQALSMIFAWMIYPLGELFVVLWIAATPLISQKIADFIRSRSSTPNGLSR
ncbi:MAG: hypothetical protein N4A41_12340 [Crocinitomicaceae bacterium]|jgi:hypothetical protein|nr:hypothetical protein [Crocinitomicaceae bacterium]